jgi:LacI family transcriptional regulator
MAGVEAAELLVDRRDFTAEHGRESATRFLTLADPPTALVAGNTQIAHGVIEAVRDMGLRLRDDVSLVCAEDPPALRLLDPSIAAIRWDFAEAGRALAELLLRRLEGGAAERVVLRTSFVPGGSCGAPRAWASA